MLVYNWSLVVKRVAQAQSAGELFIWLHNLHDEEPGRWQIFSVSPPRLAQTYLNFAFICVVPKSWPMVSATATGLVMPLSGAPLLLASRR
jgi:hypothetical protein